MTYYRLSETLSKEEVGIKAFTTSHLLRNEFPALDGFVMICPSNEMDLRFVWDQMPHDRAIVVRSSMPDEDGDTYSSAGKYETKLDCVSFEEFCYQVLQFQTGAVLVQSLLSSDVSGVMFTSTIHSDACLIESSFGLGEIIVSGKVNPDRFEIHPQTLNINSRISPDKYFGLFNENEFEIGDLFDVSNFKARKVCHVGGLMLASFPYKMRVSPSLDEKQIMDIYHFGKRLEALFGCPQDVEWAFVDNDLYLLQSRAISKALPPLPSIKKPMSGLVVSTGKFTAKAIHITKVNSINLNEQDFILIADETQPQMIYELSRAKGVITQIGGMLCHAAIVARELGIPCMVGVEHALEQIKHEQMITLDCDKGEIIQW